MEQLAHPLANRFTKGLRDGVPIALGYLSVAFTFGMEAVTNGLPVWAAVMISMTNLTSAGQFAGLTVILSSAPFFEMALTQLVINLRYSLMSLSLSQKLHRSVGLLDRLLLSFFNTDEIFTVASSQKGEIGKRYFLGLSLMPYIGWALGTFLGAAASGLLPLSVRSALGIAIYGMFIAILVPPAKQFRPVLKVILCSVLLSCLFRYVPGLNLVSPGLTIILCAVAASALGARLFPVKEASK